MRCHSFAGAQVIRLKDRRRITLSRALSKFGVTSRSQARTLIAEGRVTVNTRVVRLPDSWVDPRVDRIALGGKLLRRKKFIYLLLHKPVGVVTTRKDERGRKTVYDLLPRDLPFLFPVGRLDKDTSGLLLFTNDTRFGERMTNPATRVPKTYVVELDSPLSESEKLALESKCVMIDGRVFEPAIVKRSSRNPETCEITIFEGKNRQIRRMVRHVGHEVVSLKRVSIGPLHLGGLNEGEFRLLSSPEVALLLC